MSDKPRVGVGFGVMLINSGGKILLGQRHEDPEKASSLMHGEGTWTMPGGKFEFGEGFEEGAARETLEETGIKINKDSLRVISLANNVVSDAHFVTIGFLCDKFEGTPQVMEPDEITKWEWFDLDKLPEPMFLPSLEVVEHYHTGRIY